MNSVKITLTFDELCTSLRLRDEVVIELIELHLLIPEGKNQQEWRFDEENFRRAKIAANLHRDLEINSQGIALAVELLERIERLESELNRLQRLFE